MLVFYLVWKWLTASRGARVMHVTIARFRLAHEIFVN